MTSKIMRTILANTSSKIAFTSKITPGSENDEEFACLYAQVYEKCKINDSIKAEKVSLTHKMCCQKKKRRNCINYKNPNRQAEIYLQDR